MLNKLFDLHTYINYEVLTDVITLPLVSRGTFEVINFIAISISFGNKEFLYIDTEESILCVDQTGLYYLMVDEAEL